MRLMQWQLFAILCIKHGPSRSLSPLAQAPGNAHTSSQHSTPHSPAVPSPSCLPQVFNPPCQGPLLTNTALPAEGA